MLKNIHKEKEVETLKVVIWCHLGHAYIKEVGEGERKGVIGDSFSLVTTICILYIV